MPGDSLPARQQLGLLLRLAHQEWDRAIEQALDGAGYGDIRPAHANVFAFVPTEGIQVSDLARFGRVRKQTMTQAVDDLEHLGYVERRPDPSDRRAHLVFLTRRGKRVRPVCVAAGGRAEERWAGLAGTEVIEELRSSLKHILEQLAGEGEMPAALKAR